MFTDIEGSTRLWQQDEVAMRVALSRHDELLRKAVADHGGVVFSSMGDGMAAAFSSASAGVAAALAAQRSLAAEVWSTSSPIRVRMSVHTGEAEFRDGDYFGTAVNRAARLMAIGHGGQVLVSSVTAGMVGDTVAVLVDLGEHRLRDLDGAMHVFQVGEDSFPRLRSMESFLGNLPLRVSSFIGRERELARGVEALSSSRVVTLTGVGGVGKTRLALQLAAEVLPRFHDGAWLVELASTRDPAGVPDAVAAVFGVTARAGLAIDDILVEFLRTKQIVLVLDNCEHVLDVVAGLVERIERSCAGVVVLGTSREGLALDGEQILAAPSLPTPQSDADLGAISRADSVALFVQRAEGVDANYTLTAANAAAVSSACRRLDGLPLAIEIAAARVAAMTAFELARGLDHRFLILAGGRRRAVQRHQTLRAAIDWSYDLLSEPERCLLARLSVFAGGCNRQSAEAVCAREPIDPSTVFGLLSDLVSRSLVVAQHNGRETRYRLLETIREYGEERLAERGETELLLRGHAEYYCDLVRHLFAQIGSPEQLEAFLALDAEHDNVVRASEYAIDAGDADLGLRLLTSAFGHPEAYLGGCLPVDALAIPGAAEHSLYPAGLLVAGCYAALRGERTVAEQLCDSAVAAADAVNHPDAIFEWYAAVIRGFALAVIGQFAASGVHYERSAQIARSAALPAANLASSLAVGASFRSLAGDRGAAISLATEGLAVARQIPIPYFVAMNMLTLAGTLAESDPDEARTLFRESARLRSSFPDLMGATLRQQAFFLAAQLGDWNEAVELASTSITEIHQSLGSRAILAGVVNVVARAIASTDPEVSARLQGAAMRLLTSALQERTDPRPDRDAPASVAEGAEAPSTSAGFVTEHRRQTSSLLRHALGEPRLRELRSEGEAMDDDRVVAVVLDAIARKRAGVQR